MFKNSKVMKQFCFKKFSLAQLHCFFVYTQLNIKRVPFQTIHFIINIQFYFQTVLLGIKDRTVSDATTPGHSAPVSNHSDGVLRIPQSSSINQASPSYCLGLYQDNVGRFLLPCRDPVGVFCSHSRPGLSRRKIYQY